MTDNKYVEIGGAKSSDFAPRYDQIPASALRRIAQRFSKGNKKFDGPEAAYLGGEMNWQKGDGTFFRERFNHVIEHLLRWKGDYEASAGVRPYDEMDDDLAAAAWGIIALMWAEDSGKMVNGDNLTAQNVDAYNYAGVETLCADAEKNGRIYNFQFRPDGTPIDDKQESATDKVLSFFGLK